jgi:Putative zinc-finger
MTASTQHGFHPDAEQLSAFTEHVLPEPERDRVLAHLAACGRCRQIVALAGSAHEEAASFAFVAAAAAPSAIPHPKKRQSNPWWSRWRLVWIPAAVVAAFAVTWVSFDLHQAEQAGARIEIAKQTPPDTGPPAAPSSGEQRQTTPPAPTQSRAQQAASPPAVAAERQQSMEQTPAQKQTRLDSMAGTSGSLALKTSAGRDKSPLPLPPASAPLPPAPSDATETVTVSLDRPAPETATAQQFIPVRPVQPVQSFKPSAKASPGNLAALSPQPAASSAAPEPQAESKKRITELNHEIETAESDGHLSAESGDLQRGNAGVSTPISGGSAAGYTDTPSAGSPATFGIIRGLSSVAGVAAIPIRLPSGLAVTSMASVGHLMLATDGSGALFLTHDSGATWHRVARQWTGRAVFVRTRSLAAPAATAPAMSSASNSAPASSEPPAPPSVFEVVNERNQVWQSADGLVWQAR